MVDEKEFTEELQETFKNVEVLLYNMMSDRSVPRNIKRVAQQGISILQRKDESPGILASNIMYLVSDLSTDPNIPFHSRTVLYRIISLLEAIKD